MISLEIKTSELKKKYIECERTLKLLFIPSEQPVTSFCLHQLITFPYLKFVILIKKIFSASLIEPRKTS